MTGGVTDPVYYFPDRPVEAFVSRHLPPGSAMPMVVVPDEPAVLLVSDAPDHLAEAVAARDARAGLEIVVLRVRDSTVPAGPPHDSVYGYLFTDSPPAIVAKMLAGARLLATTRVERDRARADAARLAADLQQLNEIGVWLSSEHNLELLLERVLTGARALTRSDAGSLYLIDRDDIGQPFLRFKLTQNDSVAVPFREVVLPLTSASVAGHVALTGEPVRLPDAYAPPPDAAFSINREFDRQIGYRTKSMLVVPMRTTKDETIGVLQLINSKRTHVERFGSPDEIERHALPYSVESQTLVTSLASQAAVAVENARLYQNIHNLFEGFVRGAIVAIEARDPTTSGHSFRVADLTVALAEQVGDVASGPYASVRFTADQMREIRYASLLHDFGKVLIPEQVLVKPKKLDPLRLEIIRQRVEAFKAGLTLRCAQGKITEADLESAIAVLDRYLDAAVIANEPSVLPRPVATVLEEMLSHTFEDYRGIPASVITADEARILSIAQGSLTPDERRRIQEHVIHTFRFLSQMPWTADLQRVPDIARSHHEKLNGLGYPYGLKGDEIPIQARMMAIADIYDALTAADRPYKKAVPTSRALDMMRAEAAAGALDGRLLDVFVEGRIYMRVGATSSRRADAS